MNVDSSRVAEVIEAPDLVEQLVAGEDAVVVRREEVKKLQLLRGDVDRLALELQLVLLAADLYVVELDRLVVVLVVVRRVTAEDSLDSGGKLLRLKRL